MEPYPSSSCIGKALSLGLGKLIESLLTFSTNGKTPNKEILLLAGNRSKLYNIHGTKIIKAKIIGNNTVQQKLINWSKRILGNDARIQTKQKISIQLFIPKVKPCTKPYQKGLLLNKRSYR